MDGLVSGQLLESAEFVCICSNRSSKKRTQLWKLDENGPSIDDFPIEHGDFPLLCYTIWRSRSFFLSSPGDICVENGYPVENVETSGAMQQIFLLPVLCVLRIFQWCGASKTLNPRARPWRLDMTGTAERAMSSGGSEMGVFGGREGWMKHFSAVEIAVMNAHHEHYHSLDGWNLYLPWQDFRVYLANQQSLTKFLVHCCLQWLSLFLDVTSKGWCVDVTRFHFEYLYVQSISRLEIISPFFLAVFNGFYIPEILEAGYCDPLEFRAGSVPSLDQDWNEAWAQQLMEIQGGSFLPPGHLLSC